MFETFPVLSNTGSALSFFIKSYKFAWQNAFSCSAQDISNQTSIKISFSSQKLVMRPLSPASAKNRASTCYTE
jgi:hypothetical protein